MPVFQWQSEDGFFFIANTEFDALNYGVYDRAPYKDSGHWIFPKPVALGKLTPLGFDSYILSPRQDDMAKGLTGFAIHKFIQGSTIELTLETNIPVKDSFTMPEPINRIEYKTYAAPKPPGHVRKQMRVIDGGKAKQEYTLTTPPESDKVEE
jgi:hypothetical protein